jgi:peptide/nickel transport system permease protein
MSTRPATNSAFRVVAAHAARETVKAFNANKTSWVGLGIFVAVVLMAIFAPMLAPHDPLEQDLMYRLKSPNET